ncbi:MAG: hypothetical protein NXI04_09810 [Planctomycetaceae bacterium]|nr:hypothetical protein [Planctomycetaceae bacterium]
MSKRFRICLAVWIAVVIASACTNSLHAQVSELTPIPQPAEISAPAAPAAAITQPVAVETVVSQPDTVTIDDENWQITIIPARKASDLMPVQPVAQCDDCNQVDVTAYKRIYNSIPFNRAQFNANPNYRHDSTMEILTGNARHQTIVRHSTAPPREPGRIRTAPVAPYGNPYQFGYLRPALRLNYYRDFPSLNPYLNIWNLSGAF